MGSYLIVVRNCQETLVFKCIACFFHSLLYKDLEDIEAKCKLAATLVILATEFVKITRGLLEMLMEIPQPQKQNISLILLCNLLMYY